MNGHYWTVLSTGGLTYKWNYGMPELRTHMIRALHCTQRSSSQTVFASGVTAHFGGGGGAKVPSCASRGSVRFSGRSRQPLWPPSRLGAIAARHLAPESWPAPPTTQTSYQLGGAPNMCSVSMPHARAVRWPTEVATWQSGRGFAHSSKEMGMSSSVVGWPRHGFRHFR